MDNRKHSSFSGSLWSTFLPWSPHAVIFPFYHAVSDLDCPHLKNLYRVHRIEQFENDIDQLLQFMSPVSLEDAVVDFRKKSFAKPTFHLSFDDGLREVKEFIAPILLKKGIPATFFITTGFTNNKVLFHRHKASLIVEKLKTSNSNAVLAKLGAILNTPKADRASLQKAVMAINFRTASILDEIAENLEIDFAGFLNNEQPYLNAPEICDLKNAGFSIGLHSFNHPEFYLLNEPEMEFQVAESRKRLKELTGIDSGLFSFPFTDSGVPDQFIQSLVDKHQMTTFGTAGIKDDAIEGHFQRIPMDARPASSAIQLIANEIIRYRAKVFFNRQKVKR
jgi:peptidoglycan/xylan/chitin deacetylase (PgdA/CDA1 family)